MPPVRDERKPLLERDSRARGPSRSPRPPSSDLTATATVPPPRLPKARLDPTAKPFVPKYSSVDDGLATRQAPSSTTITTQPAPPPLSEPTSSEPADQPEPERARESVSRKLVKFVLLWGLVAAFVVYCVVEAFRSGGGRFDWHGALKKAVGGGLAGAISMVIQVLTLMPLRTTMNYQYRYGLTLSSAVSTLYHAPAPNGGFTRFYSGLAPALVQGPVARFGDTASNAGVLALLASNPFLKRLPTAIKTAAASLIGALFRMVLMPVDTLKTTMQTESNSTALTILKERIKRDGPATLWRGAFATAAANFVGSFPWFATYNYLSNLLPVPSSDPSTHSHVAFTILNLSRQASIGFVASVVSDTVSNSLRVVKTYRQVARDNVGYRQAAREIVQKEGLVGLFGRGLKTRLLANGLQGLLFSVLWKTFQELLERGGDGK
ncbi:hypothetical protein JCM10212_000767 [Sporobolomyces blumeae]